MKSVKMTAAESKKRRSFFIADGAVKVTRRTFTDSGGKEQTVTTLMGYPIVWNKQSSDRGGYVVKLAPGAAKFKTPTMALFNHSFDNVLGTTANQTLRILAADDKGIPVEIDLNMDTSTGRDVAAYVDRGDIKGMSFSMENGFEEYTESKEGDLNVLLCSKFTCDEVTVTPIPAFTETSIGMKDPDDDDETDGVQASATPGGMSASIHVLRNRLHLCRP